MKQWYSFYFKQITKSQRAVGQIHPQVGGEFGKKEKSHQLGDQLEQTVKSHQLGGQLEMPEIFGFVPWRHHVEIFSKSLDSANGLIECPQAKKLSLEMKQENTDAAKLYDSDAYEVLSYRANVIAWLKGMVLYVAHGYKWSKEIADFVQWSEKYNLWCKMLYFGEQLENELREELEIQRQSGPKNLLDLLPDEFTKDQYQQMRMSQGKSGDGDSTLRSWQNRGYIIFDDVSNRYCKTEEYLKRLKVNG